MKYSICYVSSAKENIPNPEIEKLLNQSQHDNNKNNVTGILLYSDGNFFQVLEGEREILLPLFETIKADPRHFNIFTIFEKKISDSRFSEYEVGFLSLDTRVEKQHISSYLKQIDALDPSTQSSVRYIMKQFVSGL